MRTIPFLLAMALGAPVTAQDASNISGRIARDLEEANRLRDESDAAMAAYEQELAEARTRAHGIAQDARDKAKADLDAKRARVEGELGERIAEAETRIAGVRERAMTEVSTIAEETTEAIVAALIGGTTSNTEVSAAVADARRN